MIETTESNDDFQKAEQCLERIEEVLKSPGSEDKYHLFRTFLLLYPNGSTDDWKTFSSQSLFQSFSKVLDALPVCTVIIFCRRHFSELPYFLNFFDRSLAVQMQPKSYLPYLCHRINDLPIQWVVNHLLRISDIRYAYQFLTSTFTGGIIMNPNQCEIMNNQELIWQQYLKISGTRFDLSTLAQDRKGNENSITESWDKMTSYRSLMRQLIDFKLSISLSDFRRFDKNEFVKRQLSDCSTPMRYLKLLRSAILGFAKSNSIDLEPIIISTLTHRDWPVHQKLAIIQEFIMDKENQQKAISLSTFKDEDELLKIREFAKSKNLKYEPLPDNYIEAIRNESYNRLSLSRHGRSCSIEFINTSCDSSLGIASGPEVFRSSLNLLKKKPTSSKSLAELANGSPNDPAEYMSKLKQYLNLREIAPIIALAKYGIVVSYEQFSDVDSRKELLSILVQQRGPENLNLFCEILQLSDDDLIKILCKDEYIHSGEFLMMNLIQYVNRTNSEIFLNYLKKVIDYTAKSNVIKACRLFLKWIGSTFDKYDSEYLLPLSRKALAYTALSMIANQQMTNFTNQQFFNLFQFFNDKENENEKSISSDFAKLLVKSGFEQLADVAFPPISKNFSQQAFVNGFISNDFISFAHSLVCLKQMEKSQIIDYVIAAIPAVPGVLYHRILCLYEILKENQMIYNNEIAVLRILSYASDHSIDFHALNKNPSVILVESVTINNIWDLLPLEKMYKIQGDTLLLHLMINKMNSTCYEDYKKYIARLDHKSSLEPLVQKIPSRFCTKDRISFYQGIGCIDIKKKEQTEYDLQCYDLKEYIKPEFLQNPSKLICELYSKLDLHIRLGHALHSLCSSIANRYDLHVSRICEHLLGVWLNENVRNKKDTMNSSSSSVESSSVYEETFEECCQRDDETNIQKALFILRTWKPRTAAKWLIRFIYQSDPISYRAKSKAIICLFVIADKTLISDAFVGNFEELVHLNAALYFASRLELFDIKYDIDDFSRSKIQSTIKKSMNLHPGALRVILEICIYYKINDRDLLFKLITKLLDTRMRFLLRNFNKIFETFPDLRNDDDFKRLYITVISAPINEMINKQLKSRIKSHHLAVIRDLFDSIAAESIFVDHLIIDDKEVSWADAISQICCSGITQFAAELGSHLVGRKTRSEALNKLLSDDKYDDALNAGFDKELVFNFIVENDLVINATNMLVDEHFVLFTAWLKKNHHDDAIAQVKKALLDQGRTKEVTRMEARLAKQQC
ncbi:hypothetical protein TRFO_26660 [Tritrichomonas foetus]|uniref:RZZ complex subunit KNTC1/ROD C-terminal domain-containing protein n=1 Tax=Tritrichomonas foetus TaxID=1144522 RepID=A0A1J4K2G1_9EUKA|nr:hypothetical protein TRFO_26660 [Tritrichomonas foetus]|eukprot:OHT05583.1 hypothetical protein TRFO_26660 [Tritrichomonas foetus]